MLGNVEEVIFWVVVKGMWMTMMGGWNSQEGLQNRRLSLSRSSEKEPREILYHDF
jgi:hypothetical protein